MSDAGKEKLPQSTLSSSKGGSKSAPKLRSSTGTVVGSSSNSGKKKVPKLKDKLSAAASATAPKVSLADKLRAELAAAQEKSIALEEKFGTPRTAVGIEVARRAINAGLQLHAAASSSASTSTSGSPLRAGLSLHSTGQAEPSSHAVPSPADGVKPLLERLGQRGVGLPLAASTTNDLGLRPSQSAAALRLRSEVAAASTPVGRTDSVGSSAAWVAAPMAAPAEESAADEPSLEQLITQARKPAVSSSASAFSAARTSLSTTATAMAAAAAASNPSLPAPPTRRLRVRYNHYKSDFAVVGGRLDFRVVDAEYAISFAFKGMCTCKLRSQKGVEIAPERFRVGKDMDGDPAAFGTFQLEEEEGADGGGGGGMAEYVLVVEEDPELANAPRRVYDASGTTKAVGGLPGLGSSSGSAAVTQELKSLSADELREAGPRYRALLEARDCEDVLFSGGGGGDDLNLMMGEDSSSCSCVYGNPCMSSYSCRDWKNRFEVAKRNGWKGHS